jgi:hypothetical protein
MHFLRTATTLVQHWESRDDKNGFTIIFLSLAIINITTPRLRVFLMQEQEFTWLTTFLMNTSFIMLSFKWAF